MRGVLALPKVKAEIIAMMAHVLLWVLVMLFTSYHWQNRDNLYPGRLFYEIALDIMLWAIPEHLAAIVSLAGAHASLRMDRSTDVGIAVVRYFVLTALSGVFNLHLIQDVLELLGAPHDHVMDVRRLQLIFVGLVTNYNGVGILLVKLEYSGLAVMGTGSVAQISRLRGYQLVSVFLLVPCAATHLVNIIAVQIVPSLIMFLWGGICLMLFLLGEILICFETFKLQSQFIHATAVHASRKDITSGQGDLLRSHVSSGRRDRRLVCASLFSNLCSYAAMSCFIACWAGILPSLWEVTYNLHKICWALSSIFNDICVAHMNGLFMWYVPGIRVGDQSVEAWRRIAAAGTNQLECEKLEALAYEVLSSAQLAMPSGHIAESIAVAETALLLAADEHGNDAVGIFESHATRIKELASAENTRLNAQMRLTWEAYALLRVRCGGLEQIQHMTAPCRQVVPIEFASAAPIFERQYLDWLFKEADIAEAELEDVMNQAISLLNNSSRTIDILDKLDSPSDVMESFAANCDTTVHRGANSRRPYWKMGPRKLRYRVLSKAASDYGELESPKTSHVLDLVRCSGYFDDPFTLALCFAILKSLVDIVRVKNRFVAPAPSGYRDMMLNVRLSNGHVAEVQLGFDSMVMIKDWSTPYYTLARTQNTKELLQVCRERDAAARGQLRQQGDLIVSWPQAASNSRHVQMNVLAHNTEVHPTASEVVPVGSSLVIAVNTALAAVGSDEDSVTV